MALAEPHPAPARDATRRAMLASALGVPLLAAAGASAQPDMGPPAASRTGLVGVNGATLHYEIHGAGAPLVLLHGGLATSAMFGPTLPAFAASRQVIAFDLHGHGHSPDAGQPLRYEGMADDIVAALAKLGFPTSDVMGYSLGGGVAIQMAIRHPGSVRRLVVVSAPYRAVAWYPELRAAQAAMGEKQGFRE